MTLQKKLRIFKIFFISIMVFVLAGFYEKPLIGAISTAKKILKLKKEAFGHVEQLSEQLIRTSADSDRYKNRY